jgi:hypothetical protein
MYFFSFPLEPNAVRFVSFLLYKDRNTFYPAEERKFSVGTTELEVVPMMLKTHSDDEQCALCIPLLLYEMPLVTCQVSNHSR